jgi:hypothetical protein
MTATGDGAPCRLQDTLQVRPNPGVCDVLEQPELPARSEHADHLLEHLVGVGDTAEDEPCDDGIDRPRLHGE